MPELQEMWFQSLGREDPLEEGKNTPVFLPGESHVRGAWRAVVHGVERVRQDWVTPATLALRNTAP